MIKEISNCPDCKFCEIVDGVNAPKGWIRFDPGQRKLNKTGLKLGVAVRNCAKCCSDCGLAWMDLKADDLRKYIVNKCEFEFAWKIYKPKDPENSDFGDCLNCGSKRKITGTFSNSCYPLLFTPNHLKTFNKISGFNHGDLIVYESSSDCCANCGFIITSINPDKLNRFLLKNCKPEYLKQIYSCDE